MRKRPLVIGAILFFVGILLSFCKLSGQITFLLIALICSAYFIKKGKARLFAVALIIILLGTMRMKFAQSHRNTITSQNEGKSGEMSLVIAEPTTDGRALAFLETDRGNVGVYLSLKERNELFCGDIVTGEISLSAPSESKIGTNWFSNYLASNGVYIQAEADRVRITGRYNKGIMGKIYSLRRSANEIGRNYFPSDERALFNAMIFGDKSLLSDKLYASLQGSGLNHIAVVSGMHLSIVIAFLMLFIKRLLGRGRFGFILAIIIAVFITLLTGAGASIVRALLMCFMYYLSRILYRENDGLTSLFCTFWVMVLVNPYIIFNIGFILSVFSVLGIILFSRKFSDFFRLFIPEMVADAIALTLSAQLTLTPILVCYFGIITPYAPLSNIIAVPLSSIYVILGMFFVIGSPVKPIAAVLAPATRFLADGIIRLCESISALPYATIEYTEDFLVLTVIWTFLAVMVFLHPLPDNYK